MAIENEVWSEIKITVGTKDIEVAGNIANMVVPYGIYIEDYSDLENEVMEIAHIDLIEENPIEAVSFIEERLKEQNIEYSIQIDDCATEDWVNNWKQYFHPMPIGEKLLIRPTWEDEYDAGGRKVLHIEPGLAFGTGSHPTTKLCLETLEKYIDENSTVLDIGCGSGILSIASLLLGAKNAFGVDIDSLAVKTAQANALENGFDESKFKAVQGNLSDKVSVVVANIVADIIMEFNKEVGKYLENDGVYITGGIIESREDEVLLSFAQNGFEVKERFEEKGWLVFVVKKSK